eukprot:TCONS_00066808-protein
MNSNYSNLTNSSNTRISLPSNTTTIFEQIPIVIMAIFLFFTNLFLLISLRKQSGNFHVLLKFLTLFDLLPAYNLAQDAVWKYTMHVTKVGCLINKYFFEVSYLMSGFTLALMSYDRFRVICQPLREKIENRTLYIVIGAFLIVVTLIEIYPLSVLPEDINGSQCGYSVGLDWHPVQVIIRVITLLTVITGQTISTIKIKTALTRVTGLIQSEEIHARNMKVLKSVRKMQLVFLALVLPFTLVYIFVGFMAKWEFMAIRALSSEKGSIFNVALSFTFLLSMVNHVVNPFIYGKLHQKICCRKSRRVQPLNTAQQTASTAATVSQGVMRKTSTQRSIVTDLSTRKIQPMKSSAGRMTIQESSDSKC